jgi:DnaJ-class molecular chaperone
VELYERICRVFDGEAFGQMHTKNFYETLGLLNGVDDVVIKAAYKALAQKHHPDKHKANKEFHTRVMADLNEAYAAIGTKAKRKAYDQSLKRERPKPESAKPAQAPTSPNEELIQKLQNSAMDEMAVVALFEKVFSSKLIINAGWVNSYSYKDGKTKITVNFSELKSKIIQKLQQT